MNKLRLLDLPEWTELGERGGGEGGGTRCGRRETVQRSGVRGGGRGGWPLSVLSVWLVSSPVAGRPELRPAVAASPGAGRPTSDPAPRPSRPARSWSAGDRDATSAVYSDSPSPSILPACLELPLPSLRRRLSDSAVARLSRNNLPDQSRRAPWSAGPGTGPVTGCVASQNVATYSSQERCA